MSTNYLHSLKINDLLSILRHVQLGKDHLLRKLSAQEFHKLLSVGSLSNNQQDKIESDKQEKIGNVAIVMNTILTSCFGAWLGFSAFNQNELVSFVTIFIILAAISIGPATGYLSYLLTHNQAKLALENQQLCNVERIIIEIIINKRQLAVEKLHEKINLALRDVHQKFNAHFSEKNSSIKQLLDLLGSYQANAPLSLVEKNIFNKLQKYGMRLDNDKKEKLATNGHDKACDQTDFLLNNALTNASYIKVLVKEDLTPIRQIPRVNKWLKRNAIAICAGLLPTFLGSFASMFVFLNGIPALLAGSGFDFELTPLQIMILKKLGLLSAIAISFYFAFSHIHSNYKAFKRAKQLEISENEIAIKNNQMLKMLSEFNLWTKIYYSLVLLRDLPRKEMNAEPTTHLTIKAKY